MIVSLRVNHINFTYFLPVKEFWSFSTFVYVGQNGTYRILYKLKYESALVKPMTVISFQCYFDHNYPHNKIVVKDKSCFH